MSQNDPAASRLIATGLTSLRRPTNIRDAVLIAEDRPMENWQSVWVDLRNVSKDGPEFWAELDIAPVKAPSGWANHKLTANPEMLYFATFMQKPYKKADLARAFSAALDQVRHNSTF